MPETRRHDPFAELVASLEPPLRFLRDADADRGGRVRLPLRAWTDRTAELLGGERTSAERAALGRLGQILGTLEQADPGSTAAIAAECLEILEALRGDTRRSAGLEAVADGPPGTRRSPPRKPSKGVPDGPTPERPVAPREGAVAPRERPGRMMEPAGHADGHAGGTAARGVVSGRAAGGSGDATPSAVESRLRAVAQPTSVVPGIGPTRATELERFEIASVDDLLYHLPFRYEDRRALAQVRDFSPGENATSLLEIRRVEERRVGRGGRRAVLSAVAGDDTGTVELSWFNQIRWFRSRLKPGGRWIVHGRVERGWDVGLRITHPEMESADEREDSAPSNRVIPVYAKPTTMPAAAMRRMVHAAVDAWASNAVDAVPDEIRIRLGLLPLSEALCRVHRPEGDADVEALGAFRSSSHRSIVFDEFFFLQLGLLLRKAQVARETGIAVDPPGVLAGRMIEALPFPLTRAQQRVIAEIAADQAKPHPMHRLLQGDVGSGKTVVAVAAALRAIESGWQAVLMAPTELLAEQHWETVRRVAGGLGVPLWYLSGVVGVGERREVLPRLLAGEPGLVVGTHALIQDDVRFARLGLAVIDEQHRFGVMQRATLSRAAAPGAAPDVLLMSATPIPRTLALSSYGDLDLSYLDEMPPGRKPVATTVHGMNQRRRAYEIVRREITKGRQAFIVYPLIEESEASDLRDATSALDELRTGIFPEFRIAIVHGRMPAAERDAVMRSFKAREFDVLVATTVIEVGIDVPNASVIVIEHAERFGLAQLHQLRGRVGRGSDESFCLLVADWAQSREARERLAVMTETRDGLRIAEADLAIRGPGALLGTRQAGMPDFRVANLLRDGAILREARAAAESVLAIDPGLESPEHRALRQVLEARWAGRLSLSRVG